MTSEMKDEILDGKGINRALRRIAHEIIEDTEGTNDLVLVGIRTRGVPLAKRLVSIIEEVENKEVPLGILDITLYRDDLSTISNQPVVHKTEIPFDITGKKIVLIDDVIYTGRTIRAALDALVDFGRPERIQLAVLIDRGYREFPIRTDYVGKNVTTKQNEVVHVQLEEIDGREGVFVSENDN